MRIIKTTITKKKVEFRGKQYQIEYFQIKAGITDGLERHCIYVINDESRYIHNHLWVDSVDKPENIIGHVRAAIIEYLNSIKTQFSYLDEFIRWNGKLDDWDE